MKQTLEIQEVEEQDGLRIAAAGDLIITNAAALQKQIDQAIQNGRTAIILDLSRIQYIDSFGIGVVVKSKSEIDQRKGRFKIVISDTLKTIFEKCHLDDYFDLERIETRQTGHSF